MSKRLSIVHWMPVEIYPPTMNAARFFAGHGWKVSLTTTHNRHSLPEFTHSGVHIYRARDPAVSSTARRAAAYAQFHILATLRLLLDRPDAVLYFEPQSSLPVFLAGRLRDAPVFVHHHEYHSESDFTRKGMRLARLFHREEQRSLFPRAKWISHTNAERLALFAKEHPAVDARVLRVLPNMPPASWAAAPNRAWLSPSGSTLRMVYVGSLSLRDTYLEEFVRWLESQPRGSISLDIYAYNVDAETREYLEHVSNTGQHSIVRWIHEGVAYDSLPERLRNYHTGVVFYKAHTINYRHNASNKLFEYLACGLDVVFSSQMEGIQRYASIDTIPRVIEVDFDHLDRITVRSLRNRGSLPERTFTGSAEAELAHLERDMIAATKEKRAFPPTVV